MKFVTGISILGSFSDHRSGVMFHGYICYTNTSKQVEQWNLLSVSISVWYKKAETFYRLSLFQGAEHISLHKYPLENKFNVSYISVNKVNKMWRLSSEEMYFMLAFILHFVKKIIEVDTLLKHRKSERTVKRQTIGKNVNQWKTHTYAHNIQPLKSLEYFLI